MAIFQFSNFSKATLTGTHLSTDTTLNLVSGQGARFPNAPFYLVIWNSTDFDDAADAFWGGGAEIVVVGSNPTADTLPGLTRGADGTTALNFNVADKVYQCFIPENAGWLANLINVDTVTGQYSAIGKKLDADDITLNKMLRCTKEIVTVVANVITITSSFVEVDMEGGDQTINQILPGNAGDLLWLKSGDSSQVLTITDGSNITLDGSVDASLDNARDRLFLQCVSTGLWDSVAPISNVGI